MRDLKWWAEEKSNEFIKAQLDNHLKTSFGATRQQVGRNLPVLYPALIIFLLSQFLLLLLFLLLFWFFPWWFYSQCYHLDALWQTLSLFHFSFYCCHCQGRDVDNAAWGEPYHYWLRSDHALLLGTSRTKKKRIKGLDLRPWRSWRREISVDSLKIFHLEILVLENHFVS